MKPWEMYQNTQPVQAKPWERSWDVEQPKQEKRNIASGVGKF